MNKVLGIRILSDRKATPLPLSLYFKGVAELLSWCII